MDKKLRAKAAVPCALLAVIGAPLMTVPAEAGTQDANAFQVKPAGLTGRAPCHPGKSNGFRLYCHVAVKFTLDKRKFSFKGGSCGHGQGQWGFSAGPGAVTEPAKGWTLSVHFGWLDYGKAVDKDGKYSPANGYDDIHVSVNLTAGTFVPPQSSLDVVNHAATVSLSSGMTRGSYRAHVAWASTAKRHLVVGTFHCW
ncbi:MAG TPA: hypothetical protein VKB36_21480 [Vicinamibacterales bacterium]|nr:hypothetical protein [Vicinamibacterales bacterium]